MKKTLAALAVSTALTFGGFASAAQAAVLQGNLVEVTQILDVTKPKAINGPGFQGWQGTPAFNGDVSFDLGEGDTLDFTIDFLGNQSLTANNLSFIWALFYADQASLVQGTGFFQLLGSEGEALFTSNSKTTTEGAVHFGQGFSSFDFDGGLPSTVTFYGVRYRGTLEAYFDPGTGDSLIDVASNATVTTRNYRTPAFFLNAANNVGAVPEPASWALMIAGFGAVGAAARRRAKVRVTYA